MYLRHRGMCEVTMLGLKAKRHPSNGCEKERRLAAEELHAWVMSAFGSSPSAWLAVDPGLCSRIFSNVTAKIRRTVHHRVLMHRYRVIGRVKGSRNGNPACSVSCREITQPIRTLLALGLRLIRPDLHFSLDIKIFPSEICRSRDPRHEAGHGRTCGA